jgi:organic hydroperoxide reductase OsmC/OhrA
VSQYDATVHWERGDQEFLDDNYSRGHEWRFDGGFTVPASASPGIVPLPMSIAEHVDPEEAFVASLSSCHMLFFLSLARIRDIVVDRYIDEAVGFLAEDSNGKTAMTRVVLRPKCEYAGEAPDPALIEKLHHKAHELCNSVTSEVVTEIIS